MTATTSDPPEASSTRNRGHLPGIAFAGLSASAYSLNTIMARLAFDTGLDAPTGNAARFLFTVLVLLLVIALRRPARPLTLRQRVASLALGVPFFFTSFGYLGSIQYIPVSMAVLLLYTYPILVGLIARMTERAPLGPLRLAALGLAFLGLALSLDVKAGELPDWRGLGLALLAAVSLSIMIVGSSRVMQAVDRSAVNLHLMLSAAALFLVLLFAGGEPHWPQGSSGWLAFAGLLVSFVLGQLTLIASIARAGPVLAATVMNLEPLITIGLAVLLVGEHLSLFQLGGAGLVVLAIFVMGRASPGTPAPLAEP